ncbi:MAG TPA: DUF2267 domain-containing protein [Acidimicrobiales bacterium]|nr:DUF2267 domain-containing protein [Acidimicrobiales bacterium]
MRRLRSSLIGVAAVATAGVATAVLLRPGSAGRRRIEQSAGRLGRRARRQAGRWRGVAYRLQGRRPDPGAPDDVVADRIRSTLGPLEARLDVPHVNVTVERHVALLHGDVSTAAQAAAIEGAVARVSGVDGVRSRLHVGLVAGDTRPSEGARSNIYSPALRTLREAAVGAGADRSQSTAVVATILAVFAGQLPAGEREHFLGHLPADVRQLAAEGTRLTGRVPHVRSVGELMVTVLSDTGGVPLGRAENVIGSVVATLRELVPEESADIAAVLPADLRAFWKGAVTGG